MSRTNPRTDVFMRLVIVLLATFMIAACDDDTIAPAPELTAAATSVDLTAATITINATGADKVAVLCLPATQKHPTPAQVWQDGHNYDGNTAVCQLTDLTKNTDYVAYVVAGRGSLVTTQDVAFTTLSAYDADYTMQDGLYLYYGDFYGTDDGTGWYYLVLGAGEVTQAGLPTAVGEPVLHLFIGAPKGNDGDEVVDLPEGTYSMSDGSDLGIINFHNSRLQIPIEEIVEDGDPTGRYLSYLYQFLEGSVTVKHNDDGTYTIEGTMRTGYDTMDYIHFAYTGELGCVNNNPALYTPVREDHDITEPMVAAAYMPSGDYGIMYVTLYNTPLRGGSPSGAGQLLNINYITPYFKPFDITQAHGTYTVVKPVSGIEYKPGDVVGGVMARSQVTGRYSVSGSVLGVYNDSGVAEAFGMIDNGTFVATLNERQDQLTFDADFYTDYGCHITGAGTIASYSIVDYSIYFAPRQANGRLSNSSAEPQRVGFTPAVPLRIK